MGDHALARCRDDSSGSPCPHAGSAAVMCIDCGGRLNRLQSELEPRAVLRLRGIPHTRRDPQREARGNRKSRRGNAPERGPIACCPGARGGEQQQSNKQQANALHAERYSRLWRSQLKSTIFNRYGTWTYSIAAFNC